VALADTFELGAATIQSNEVKEAAGEKKEVVAAAEGVAATGSSTGSPSSSSRSVPDTTDSSTSSGSKVPQQIDPKDRTSAGQTQDVAKPKDDAKNDGNDKTDDSKKELTGDTTEETARDKPGNTANNSTKDDGDATKPSRGIFEEKNTTNTHKPSDSNAAQNLFDTSRGHAWLFGGNANSPPKPKETSQGSLFGTQQKSDKPLVFDTSQGHGWLFGNSQAPSKDTPRVSSGGNKQQCDKAKFSLFDGCFGAGSQKATSTASIFNQGQLNDDGILKCSKICETIRI
jgi:hypothetical protein